MENNVSEIKNSILNIRLFGAKDCVHCDQMIKMLEIMNLNYEFIDANDPKNEEICDSYNIDHLPCIQIHKNNEILIHHVGYINIRQLFSKAFEKIDNDNDCESCR